MSPGNAHEIRRLLKGQRLAALATLHDGRPYCSMVAFVAEPDFGGLLLHLSRLAAHTRHLLGNPNCSLLISAPETPEIDDIQTLPRITLTGHVNLIERGTETWKITREAYVAHLPASAVRFSLGDFELFRFVPEAGRFVGGFARTVNLDGDSLRSLANPAQADAD